MGKMLKMGCSWTVQCLPSLQLESAFGGAYNRIAHSMASLTLRTCKVRQSSVTSMPTLIQSMEYYLRTICGKSTTYSGRNEDPKQGSCQGNTATPTMRQRISSLLTNTQKHAGHGMTGVSIVNHKENSQPGWHLVCRRHTVLGRVM